LPHVDPAGQLADLGAVTGLPARLDRRRPRRLRLREDRLADVLVDLHPQGEPDAALAQVPGQPGAAAGAVGADQHRPLVGGELGQGEVDQLDQVVAGAGRGVARPQQARQRLAGSLAAVQVGQQRREPEGVLVGARRPLLGVGLRQHQGRVGVDDQQLDVRVAADGPGAGAGVRPGGPQPCQPARILAGSFDDPPGGRGRGYRAEQGRLVPQGGQVGQAVAAVGQHHRQVPQHVRVRMPPPAARLTPAQRPGQPKPVGQLPQQRRAGMPDHPGAVGGDFEAASRVGSLHPQGALLDGGYDLRTAVSSLVRRALAHLSPGHQPPHEKPRLGPG
jgi:hypothetical protein